MSKVEYSRILMKRTTTAGVEPTEPSGNTITKSWLDTDVLVGEMFANVADDRLWFRSQNGIIQIPTSLSGVTNITDFCGIGITTDEIEGCGGTGSTSVKITLDVDEFEVQGVYNDTLVTDTILITDNFNTNTTTSLSNKPTISVGARNSTIGSGNTSSVLVGGISNKMYGSDSVIAGGTYNKNYGDYTFIGGSYRSTIKPSSNYSGIVGGEGNTINSYYSFIGGGVNNYIKNGSIQSGILAGDGNTIKSGTTHSVIIGGTDNVIDDNLVNTIVIGGNGLSATTSNTTYVDNLNINGDVQTSSGSEIKGYLDGGTIKLDAYASKGDIEITTDNGGYGVNNPYIYLNTGSTFTVTIAAENNGAYLGLRTDDRAIIQANSSSTAKLDISTSETILGSGDGETLTLTDTAIFTCPIECVNIKLNTIGSGTPVTNLGIDASGNVVSGSTSVSGDINMGTDKISYVTDIEEYGITVNSSASTNTTYTVATLSNVGDSATIEVSIHGSNKSSSIAIIDPKVIGGTITGLYKKSSTGVSSVGSDNIIMNRSNSNLDFYLSVSGNDILINFDNSALAEDIFWTAKIRTIIN